MSNTQEGFITRKRQQNESRQNAGIEVVKEQVGVKVSFDWTHSTFHEVVCEKHLQFLQPQYCAIYWISNSDHVAVGFLIDWDPL